MYSIRYLWALLLSICILCLRSVLATEARDVDATAASRDDLDGRGSVPRLGRRFGSLLRHARRTSTETCPTNYFQCGNSLPSNFCCPTGDVCNSLADNTTVLCCPDGQDCGSIEPITCGIAYLNATAFPATSVHTTNLTGQLPTCGNGCCPFGYTCEGNSTCTLSDEDATLETATSTTLSSAPIVTVSVATGTATTLVMATATTESASTHTSDSSSASASSSSSSGSSDNTHRTIGVAAGSAAAGVACIAGLILFALARRRRAARAATTTGPAGPSGAQGRSARISPTQQGRSAGTLLSKSLSASVLSHTPPPLPPKEPYQVPKRKRKSFLSWVPSIVNRTPAELPATPVSFSQWAHLQRPDGTYRHHTRESLDEVHELEADARWLPQERPR